MKLVSGEIYHIFNRGNDKQIIFPKEENYLYFLQKIRYYIFPCCDILAWCLMPNHFHLLIFATPNTIEEVNSTSFPMQKFSYGLKQLLSSYTKAINNQENKTGSLFQQKTKSVQVSKRLKGYSLTAFHYIHQNPLSGKLVDKMEDWTYSSFRDYCGLRKGTLCNIPLASEILDISLDRFYADSYQSILNQEVPYTLKV